MEAATSVGQRLVTSAEEFDSACEHIVQLLIDASSLLEAGSHATAAFLSITALEETAKVHIGMQRRSNELVARHKDPLYQHAEKHKLALSPNLSIGSRIKAAIGENHWYKLISQGQAGELVKIREAALYLARNPVGIVTPKSAVPFDTSRKLLLLATEAFDEELAGYTNNSLKLSKATDTLFTRWKERMGPIETH